MFENKYKLKISGKNCKTYIKELIKNKVNFKDLEFINNDAYIIVDYINYKKITSVKTSYTIKIVRLYGNLKLKDILKRYLPFFIGSTLGLILLIILSNVILKVEVINNKTEIRDLVYKELDKYNIKKYKFIIPFKKQEEIVKKILEDNKEKIEWLEIERIGTKYIVKVEERVLKENTKETEKRHIVAKKAGIITSITAERGEIVKSVNNYVKKGDIIISGYIKKNDQIVGTTSATGRVYAEIWYLVDVSLPIRYYEERYTGKTKKTLSISILGKNINILDFNNYKYKKVEEIKAIKDRLGLIGIGIYKEKELNIIDKIYSIETATITMEEMAIEKIKQLIKDKGEIISQKKLKIVQNNSTIDMKVFFKVCEDITDTAIIIEEPLP